MIDKQEAEAERYVQHALMQLLPKILTNAFGLEQIGEVIKKEGFHFGHAVVEDRDSQVVRP